MEKEFSEGFLKDLADLIEMCGKENTDTVSLSFVFNGKKLKVNMTFSVSDEDTLPFK